MFHELFPYRRHTPIFTKGREGGHFPFSSDVWNTLIMNNLSLKSDFDFCCSSTSPARKLLVYILKVEFELNHGN